MTFPVFIKASKSKISIAKEIREVNRLRLQFEKSLETSLIRVFSKVGREAAKEFEQTGSVVEAVQPMQREIGQILFAHSTAVLTTFGNRVFENRKLSFESLINTFYSTEQASKVVGIAAVTRNQINRAILAAEEEGLGVQQTAKLIRERTSGAIGRSRASTIARTETHAAASYANHEAQKLLELPNQKKRWVSVGDGRTRSHHAAANGQEVGMDEKFVIRFKGQEILMNYPHDGSGGAANNVNCRCLAVYFSDEDEIIADTSDDTVVSDKPIIDISSISEARGESVTVIQDALNDGLTPLGARIASKLPLPNIIYALPNAKKTKKGDQSSYNRYQKRIQSTDDAMTHEYGHHVDFMIAQKEGIPDDAMWSKEGLRKAWNEDRKNSGLYRVSQDKKVMKLLEIREELFIVETSERINQFGQTVRTTRLKGKNFDGANGASDIIDSFVNGEARDYGFSGHRKKYWKDGRRRGVQQSEAFANMYRMLSSPKAVKWAEQNIPNMWAAFLAKLEELDSG